MERELSRAVDDLALIVRAQGRQIELLQSRLEELTTIIEDAVQIDMMPIRRTPAKQPSDAVPQ